MTRARWFDLLAILLYMALMAAVGLRFSRRQTSTERYFVAQRSVRWWAMGLSMLATLISSVTFVAYPGAAYAGNWSLLVPGFMAVGVLALAGWVIIPFYRHAVRMSAYEYFEKRFGRPVRLYASLAFSLAHFSKMAFVFYLTALTIHSITGLDMDWVIAGVGAVMVFYTLIGGIEAVIWTDVIQAFLCWTGVFVCLAYLLLLPPGGPGAVLNLAAGSRKFTLGELSLDFSSPTVPVLLLYGFFWYLQRYAADQTLVQRYLVAPSDRAAIKGVGLGALLCVPVWTLFMLIGTCTWAYFRLTGEQLPAYITKADQVFPYFIGAHLPVGISSLFLAALTGAAMTMLASDLNSLAMVGVEDFYRPLRPASGDRQRLRAGRILVVLIGGSSAIAALGLAHAKGGALQMWFTVSAIVSGGLAGLFLLAFLSRRANQRGAGAGILASVLVTVWAALTRGGRLLDLGPLNYGWDELTIGAVGHVVLLVVGYLVSLAWQRPADKETCNAMTFWGWLQTKRSLAAMVVREAQHGHTT